MLLCHLTEIDPGATSRIERQYGFAYTGWQRLAGHWESRKVLFQEVQDGDGGEANAIR